MISNKEGGGFMKKVHLTFLRNILLCIISFFMVFSLLTIGHRYIALVKRNQMVTKKLETLQEEKETLQKTVKNLQNPEYVIRYARDNYMFIAEGEDVIKLP